MNRNYLPMNAAVLMDRVFDLYKSTFKTQIVFSLIIGIIFSILIVVSSIVLAFGVTMAMYVGDGLYYDSDRYIIAVVLVVLASVLPLYIIWIYLSSSGHILISKQAFYNQPVELPFRDTFKALLRVLSSAFAQLIMIIPWLIPVVAITLLSVGNDFAFLYSVHPFLMVLFVLIFAVLLLIYTNIFALSIPIAIFEKRLFFATITRSFQLIKDDFWKILGLRLLWALIIYLFSYSAQGLIITIIAIITMLTGNIIDFGYLLMATGTVQFYASLLVAILMGPMEGIMTALIFFNQKIKKDGLDIEICLNRLAKSHNSGERS